MRWVEVGEGVGRGVQETVTHVGSFELRLEIHVDQNRCGRNQRGLLMRSSPGRTKFGGN